MTSQCHGHAGEEFANLMDIPYHHQTDQSCLAMRRIDNNSSSGKMNNIVYFILKVVSLLLKKVNLQDLCISNNICLK